MRAGEGARLRDLRLRALKDAPWAFDSPYDEEVRFSEADWASRAGQSETAEEGVVFVAGEAARLVGMAGGFLPEIDGPVAMLWGMWVEPATRGSGVGGSLIDFVIGWAKEREAGELRLSISQDDRAAAAAALYRGRGFTDTGDRGRLRADRSIVLEEWSLTF